MNGIRGKGQNSGRIGQVYSPSTWFAFGEWMVMLMAGIPAATPPPPPPPPCSNARNNSWFSEMGMFCKITLHQLYQGIFSKYSRISCFLPCGRYEWIMSSSLSFSVSGPSSVGKQFQCGKLGFHNHFREE